ncbi:hypothetical protein HZS_6059 [Henneguya salminicola]|nr:hypothetical protein HZS_6059 [Henneguya salminicola]
MYFSKFIELGNNFLKYKFTNLPTHLTYLIDKISCARSGQLQLAPALHVLHVYYKQILHAIL